MGFADIDRDNPGQGYEQDTLRQTLYSYLCSILEYFSRDDAEHALRVLDGKDLRGQPVRVAMGDEVDSVFSQRFLVVAQVSPAARRRWI